MRHTIAMTSAKRGKKAKPRDAEQLARIKSDVIAMHDRLHTWQAVGAHFSISRAAAHRIANDKTYCPSQATIDKMLAVPIPKPRQPRRFYRPCLSVELGEIMREYGWSPEVILWQWVKTYREQETP